MEQQLIQIYNILCQIETKGQSIKSLASCMILIEEIIRNIQAERSEKEDK